MTQLNRRISENIIHPRRTDESHPRQDITAHQEVSCFLAGRAFQSQTWLISFFPLLRLAGLSKRALFMFDLTSLSPSAADSAAAHPACSRSLIGRPTYAPVFVRRRRIITESVGFSSSVAAAASAAAGCSTVRVCTAASPRTRPMHATAPPGPAG